MSGFHEVSFPFRIALGAVGGPERRTEIVPLVSGREERNTPWQHSRRRWDVAPGVQSLADADALIAFFEARRGPLHGFRFRDPFDHKSCAPNRDPAPLDQVIGTGDGVQTQFALTKTYAHGGHDWTRPVTKPVEASVRAAVDGVESAISCDAATGVISFAVPPAAGMPVTAGFIFECPARFDTDRLDFQRDHVEAATLSRLPILELIG
ncbi:DUF2460 domain-containing protein [Maricaulis sp.]|uniref:DUF2460 domain-containing protein n=1 Tax=Maricaulis sp. TaxID=1486257 RepID=UPI00260D5F14|nr:DUF2460 domain-containing protein [Maricaulis sp.]